MVQLHTNINYARFIEAQATQATFNAAKVDNKHHASAKHMAEYVPNSKGVVKVITRNKS